jgi:Trp operon repressor
MYNIDCLTTGDCQIWSWVITALTLVSVLSSTVILVAVAVNPTLSNGLITYSFVFNPETKPATPQPSPVIITTVPTAAATTTSTIIPITATAATPAATAATPATTPAAAAPVSEADNTHNTNYFKKMWEDNKQFMEQQFQKQKYISAQFQRKDLTQDEKKALWRQQLEYEYKNLVNTEENLQKILLNAKGFPPEIMEQYRNMSKINQRFIQQREKMTVEYPVFFGTFNPETIASIKLQIKLNIEQKQIIQQELLKAGLTNDEKRALEQQLVILQKLHDELPPKEGTYLYDAYIASNK